MKKRIVEIAVKVVVAALTAFLTAITTTSCMGLGPITMWRGGSDHPLPLLLRRGKKKGRAQGSPLYYIT